MDDLVTGKAVVEGKSGKPVGTVSAGFVKRVDDDKGKTVITIEAKDEKSFSYQNDRKYDHFAYVMATKNNAQPSLESVRNRNIDFFESFTFGGDPKEFTLPGDFNSGPSFRFRTFVAIVPNLPGGEQHPLPSAHRKISWKDLESERISVIGRLGEKLGTVMECHCRITKDRRSLVLSTSTIEEMIFDRMHVVFKKIGCEVEWKYIAESSVEEFDSICYERVDCLAIPKRARDAFDFAEDATNDVRPSDSLVVRLPVSIKLPGFDIELPGSNP
ncbi:hypothetical protein SH501x_000154 [Pirellulaceae bacterium SH501]